MGTAGVDVAGVTGGDSSGESDSVNLTGSFCSSGDPCDVGAVDGVDLGGERD
jgi:hypothetical protein